MLLKDLLGVAVLNNKAAEIGKVDDFDFDKESGQIEKLIVSLNKGIISKEKVEVLFSDIAAIGDYVLLDIELAEEVESD